MIFREFDRETNIEAELEGIKEHQKRMANKSNKNKHNVQTNIRGCEEV